VLTARVEAVDALDAFRLLTRKRKIRTRVTVTLKNAAGLTSTAGKTITLEAPKPRR
jgi:hypothetical protein